MTLVRVEDAQALALAQAHARASEVVGLRDAVDRIVAESVTARFDLPAADTSIMDGYACATATLRGGAARVVGESAAGRPWPTAITEGTAVRISTGAVVPAGAELVVAQEDSRRDGDAVVFDAAVVASATTGRHIRSAASDVRIGAVLVSPGQSLGPAELALLGAAGVAHVAVIRRPRVAILSTGDELVAIGEQPGPGGVISTNGMMLALSCTRAGAEVVSERTVGDDPAAVAAALGEAIAAADVVLTSGGASAGDHDHIREAARSFDVLVWGIALRPGKPTGIVRTRGGLWFALPGNPASSFVTFELFVRPALRRMLGVRGDPRRPLRRMIAGTELRGDRTREHWVRARTDGERVLPLSDQMSGNLRSLATADALVRIPIGTTHVEAGAACDVLVFDTNAHERVT